LSLSWKIRFLSAAGKFAEALSALSNSFTSTSTAKVLSSRSDRWGSGEVFARVEPCEGARDPACEPGFGSAGAGEEDRPRLLGRFGASFDEAHGGSFDAAFEDSFDALVGGSFDAAAGGSFEPEFRLSFDGFIPGMLNSGRTGCGLLL
jgi:hypothetical protein